MIDFEILKKQNNLLTDNGLIYVKPINQVEYITHPLDDLKGVLALTKEEYLGLKANYFRFNEKLDGLEINQ